MSLIFFNDDKTNVSARLSSLYSSMKSSNNSIELLQKSLLSLNNLKNMKKYNKYDDIINQTESECSRYLKENLNKQIDLFKLISNGNTNTFNNLNLNQSDFNKFNDEGLSPLHYCIKMGDMKILKKLLKLGGRINQIDKNGHSLLEYACLEKDPNSIQFIILHGGDMKKHLFLRDGVKYNIKNNDIDSAIILKSLILQKKNEINDELIFLYDYFEKDELIGIDDYTFQDILKGITEIFKKIPKHYATNYLDIIKEELKYDFKNKLGCPNKKIDIILFNLVPFTNYPFNVSSEYLLINEIKYILTKVFKNNFENINSSNSKKLINVLWKKYINNNLYTYDYIGILTNQLISKINL